MTDGVSWPPADGEDGAPGTAGSPGEQGPPGATGEQGPQGDPGTPGADGDDGAPGPQGESGTDGSPGADGADGLPGIDGAPGADGDTGPEGPVGPAGATGDTGPAGADGTDGADGAPGTPGVTGAAGTPGAPGTPGATGPAGGIQARTTAAEVSSSLATLVQFASTCSVLPGPGVRIFRLVTSHPARVRLYDSTTHRDADAARAPGMDPLGNHGVLLDVVTTGAILDLVLSPAADIHSASPIPLIIDNLDTVTRTITVTFHYVNTED